MGYIKIDRKILEWEWYTDVNTFRVFIHMILKANWKDAKFQGVEVPRGSFVSSYSTIASETCLSLRSVRTAIAHLTLTGEVTVKRHAKFSVFTVKNYCLYQSSDTVNVTELTVKRQSNDTQNDSQTTTIEEIKEVKKGRSNNNNNICFAPPTVEDVRVYRDEKGYKNVDPERFVDFYSSKGWMVGKNKMKDWKAAVRNWERQAAGTGTKTAKPRNGFNNFQQRDYDFGALEAKLLATGGENGKQSG